MVTEGWTSLIRIRRLVQLRTLSLRLSTLDRNIKDHIEHFVVQG